MFFEAVERGTVKLSLQPDTARPPGQIATVLVWIFARTTAYEYIPGSHTDDVKAIGVLGG